MKLLRPRSIGTRIFLLFAASFFCLLVILSLVYYESSSGRVKKMLDDAAAKNVMQARDHVDLLLKGYDSLGKSIVTNPDIQRLLGRKQENPAVRAINERTITNALGAIYYAWDDVIGIHVLGMDGAVYSYGGLTQVIEPGFASSEWYRRLNESGGETVWLGMERNSVIEKNGKGSVFAFGRKLYNLNRSETVGLVLIEMKPRVLKGILENMNFSGQMDSFLVHDGQIKAHPDTELLQTSFEYPLPAATVREQSTSSETDSKRLIASALAINDWQMVSVIKLSVLQVELSSMKHYFIGFTLGLMVLSLLLTFFLSVSVTAPFKQMIRYMKKAKRGRFEEIPKVKSYIEIEVLTDVFNQMVHQIDELFVRVKEVSESEKIAQLNALQSQVNPHFLYNTLDMIYWMLDEKENEQLCNVILALSGIFRYSSNWSKGSEATIREELEQIRNYALITQMRFEDKLVFEWDLDPSLMDLQLPKMSLQPIVENAVIHGIGKSGGSIRIGMRRQDDKVLLIVEDTGSGMSIEAVEEMNRIFNQDRRYKDRSEHTGSGIGLLNVHRRIAYRFGGEFGLHLTSGGSARGTTVSVSLPLNHLEGSGRSLQG
ncbi:cache domain-containing sensor histidine kinase [Paenibacillus eucommiae]|uniref:histidine kinase n=1 Tax=Paenibacillus eucommiae TaxID=1355755 RepID=A0ABS4IMK4_9BACL|nr:sensor histidine kinase [Paenibacillus eucommiae]MBP1988807.1 two-component system sensor histidine kinase YesM [Paenibacillus eucommiae]